MKILLAFKFQALSFQTQSYAKLPVIFCCLLEDGMIYFENHIILISNSCYQIQNMCKCGQGVKKRKEKKLNIHS